MVDQAFLDSIQPLYGGGGMPPAAPAPQGLVGPALASGGRAALGMLGSAAQGVSQAAGWTGAADAAKQFAAEQFAKSQENANPDLEKAPWYSPQGLAYNVLKGAPQLGATVAASLAGEAAAGPPGAAAAAMASMYPFLYGGNVEAAKKQAGGDLTGRGNALAAGLAIPESALAGIMPANLGALASKGAVGGAIGKIFSEDALKKATEGTLGQRIFTGGWMNAAVQAPAAAIQTAATQQAFGDPNEPMADRAREIVNSALSGGLQGGVLGGAFHGVFKARDPNALKNDELERVTAASLGQDQAKTVLGGVGQTSLEGTEVADGAVGLKDLMSHFGGLEAEGAPGAAVSPDHELVPTEANLTPDQQLQSALNRQGQTGLEGTETAGTVDGGIPFMITAQMKADLAARGRTPEEIRNMTPMQAHEILTNREQALRELVGDRLEGAQGEPVSLEHELAPTATPQEQLQSELRSRGQAGLEGGSEGEGYVTPDPLRTGLDAWGAEALQHLGTPDSKTPYRFLGDDGVPDPLKVQGSFEPDSLASTVSDSQHLPVTFKITPDDSMTEAAQKILGRKVTIRSKADDLAEAVADTLDQPKKPTLGETAVLQHLDLVDATGAPVPLKDAIDSVQAKLDAAKQSHAEALGHVEKDAWEQTINGLQEKADILDRVQAATDKRPAVADAIDAAGKAVENHVNERTALLKSAPDVLHGDLLDMEGVRNADVSEKTKGLAEDVIQAAANGTSTPVNVTRRAGRLKVAAAAEEAARTTPEPFAGPTDWSKVPATNYTPPRENPDSVANEIASRVSPAEGSRRDRLRAQQAAEDQAISDRQRGGTSPIDVNAKAQDAQRSRRQASVQRLQDLRAADRAGSDGEGYRAADDGNPNYPRYGRAGEANPHIDGAVNWLIAKGGSGRDALELIARSHPDPKTRELAYEMYKKGLDAKLETKPTGNLWKDPDHPVFGENTGGFDPETGSVGVFSTHESAANILHEMSHVGQARALESGSRTAKAAETMRLKFKAVADAEGSSHYGLTNKHEFLAEANSNPRFQAWMKTARVDGVVGKLWRDVKNWAWKAVGLPDRVRSAFDDVFDISHRLMDEQLKLTNGQRVPADVAPRVGSVPDADHMMRSYIGDRSKEILQTGENWLRDNGALKTGAGQKTRAMLLGWMDSTGLMKLYAHHFGGDMESYFGAKRTNDSIRERLAQSMGAPGVQAAAKFKAANSAKVVKTWNTLQGDAQVLGSDLDKNWAQQDASLHARPDRAIIAPMIDEANRQWQAMKQNGGAEVARKMISGNRADFYSNAIAVGEQIKDNFYANEKIPGFGLNKHDEFLADKTGMHNDVDATQAFFRKAFNDQRDGVEAYWKAENARAQKIPLGKDGYPTPEAQKILDHAGTIKQAFDAFSGREDRMNISPYMHLGRYGDWFNSFKLDKGVNGWPHPNAVAELQRRLDAAGLKHAAISTAGENNSVYIRSENPDQMAQIHKIAQGLERDGFLADKIVKDKDGNDVKVSSISKGGRLSMNREMLREMAPGWMQKLANTMEQRWEAQGITADKHASMLNDIHSIWLDMIPDNSIQRMMENREGVQGHYPDMVRNFAQRMQVGINASAHSVTTPRVLDALTSMRGRVEAAKSDAKFSPDDQVQMQQVVNELLTRDARRPWSLKIGLLDTLLAANHSYFIGLSPAYATELMSQLGTLGLPELGKKYGMLNSASAMARATPAAMKIMKAVMNGGHLIDATIILDDLKKGGVPQKDIDFILGAANRGGFELSSFTRALTGDSTGRLNTSKRATFMKYSNALALNSEVFPRVLMALAARDLWEADRSPNKMALEHYVDETVSNSMMDWATYTTPRHLGKMGFAGPLSPLVTKFMSYQLKMLERLHSETITAFGNHAERVGDSMVRDGTLKAADRDAYVAQMQQESKKFLAGHLGATAVLAGSLGMPFLSPIAGAISGIANTLTNSDDFDLEQSYRKHLTSTFGDTAGQVIAHGLPRAFGVDMSELGEDRLLPFSDLMTDKRKWEDSSKAFAYRALGSPWSMINNIFRGGRDMYMGNTLGGARELAPSAVKNLVDMYRMTQYGYVDKDGRKLPVGEGRSGEASTLDIMKQAVGLHSADLADYEERARALEGYRERRQFLSSAITTQLARAMESGNAEDVKTWSQRAASFGESHPLNNPLVQLGKMLDLRRRQVMQARAFGTPLGTRVMDPMEMYYGTN